MWWPFWVEIFNPGGKWGVMIRLNNPVLLELHVNFYVVDVSVFWLCVILGWIKWIQHCSDSKGWLPCCEVKLELGLRPVDICIRHGSDLPKLVLGNAQIGFCSGSVPDFWFWFLLCANWLLILHDLCSVLLCGFGVEYLALCGILFIGPNMDRDTLCSKEGAVKLALVLWC